MIKTISYSEFSRQFHIKAMGQNIPLDGTIELTAHCNLQCAHCYIRDNSISNKLSYREICRIIDEIADAGCLWLLITGGEPLARDDFYEIYGHAKQKGLIITLFTNGTMISEETAIFLRRLLPFNVEITLYGATRETYEAVTGAAGSYEACIRGINLLLKHNIPLSLKTMVTTINKHELDLMKEFAGSLGLRFRYDSIISPRLDGSKSPYAIRITDDEVVKLDINDNERTEEWIKLYEEFNGTASKKYLFNCGAGKGAFHITHEGGLRICEFVREPDYNLRNNSFIGGYKQFSRVRTKKLKGIDTCSGCDNILFCDNCPGFSMLEGDKEGERPVSYHCNIARKRSEYIRKQITCRRQ